MFNTFSLNVTANGEFETKISMTETFAIFEKQPSNRRQIERPRLKTQKRDEETRDSINLVYKGHGHIEYSDIKEILSGLE